MASINIYRGKATISEVYISEMSEQQLSKLPEADKYNAFMLVFVCKELYGEETHEVKLEVSHRELSGKMLSFYSREDGSLPTQMDVTLRSLSSQGILPKGAKEADIANAVDPEVIGHTVNIWVTEDEKPDGGYWPPKGRFCSEFSRLSGGDAQSRIAAFISGKPAQKVDSFVKKSHKVDSVPAPIDDDDVPF